MAIQSLLNVLPQPQNPVEIGKPEQWSTVEDWTGLNLPDDFKKYINIFGTGVVGSVIRPLNPFSKAPRFDFFAQVKAIIDTCQTLKTNYGESWCPYPLYPEPNGLLPWGNTLDGDALFWHTKGSKDTWYVVLIELRSRDLEVFTQSMTDFLRDFVLGNLESDILPEASRNRLFQVAE